MGLFGKPEVRKPAPTPEPAPRSVAASSPAPPATLIGREARIKGELLSSDDVHIEGQVEGKIKGAKRVVIGESGRVQAEVEADSVTIRGKLEGDCVAANKVEITGTGKVYGNIRAPRIAVAEGAIFRGASNMTVEAKTPPPPGPGDLKLESAKKHLDAPPPEPAATGTSPKL